MSDPMLQNYIEILEKTNQQLSLWYSPFSLVVGFLGIFIALLAIFFAFVLWRQGKDYRDFLADQKKVLGDETRKYAKSILDEHIGRKDVELKHLKGEAREKIEQELDSLKKARESLNASAMTISKPLAYQVVRTAPVANNPLTDSQIDAIISLLQSFGADRKTITDVERALR